MNRVYQLVTDKIIEKLEEGCVPWRMPWSAESFQAPIPVALFLADSHSDLHSQVWNRRITTVLRREAHPFNHPIRAAQYYEDAIECTMPRKSASGPNVNL